MGLVSDVTSKFSFGGFNFGGITHGLTLIVLVALVSILLGVGIFLWIQHKKFNKKIEYYEDVSGHGYVLTARDTARLIKVGEGGEELIFTKKGKKYLTAYGKKAGKEKYLFAKGSDGYWYNFTLSNLNTSLRELKIDPIDRDMRYMQVAIRKNTQQRFEQKNWLKENIGLIVGASVIVIVLVFIWLLFDKYVAIANSSNAAIDAAAKVLETTQKILAANDNILSGGSGITPA